MEIKPRITPVNSCYFGLNRQLSSRDLSRATKLIPYKVLNLPVLLYGAEVWTVSSADAAALVVFERKVLRMIFGPVRVGDVVCSGVRGTWPHTPVSLDSNPSAALDCLP